MRHKTRIGMIIAVIGLTTAALAPMALGATGKATGTVVVKVKYKTPDGKLALEGVEVFLNGAGQSFYGCTNTKGVVRFSGVPSGTDLISATGPSVVEDCENGDFLNPDSGKEMYTIRYQNNHGVTEWDTFQVDDGGKKTIKYVAKTPARKKICSGNRVTIVGTNASEEIVGTDDNDVINARGGDDLVTAGAGNDTVCGDKGSDDLRGEDGDDFLLGGPGSDSLDGGNGFDLLNGGAKNDMCVNGETLLSCEA
jgi:Ca2+-binding RTX toxin-like protein